MRNIYKLNNNINHVYQQVRYMCTMLEKVNFKDMKKKLFFPRLSSSIAGSLYENVFHYCIACFFRCQKYTPV